MLVPAVCPSYFGPEFPLASLEIRENFELQMLHGVLSERDFTGALRGNVSGGFSKVIYVQFCS